MLAHEFIDRLERRGLLDQEIIEALREQLAQSSARVTPEAVAKLLVDNGQLTRFQASQLIGQLRNEDDEEVVEAVAYEDDLTAIGEDPFADDPFGSDAMGDVVEAEPIMGEAEPVAVAVMAEEVAEPVPYERPLPRGNRKAQVEEKSIWDSFKIYGYVGIIAGLSLCAWGLATYLGKESADDAIAIANKLYDDQSYQPAQDSYASFLINFGQSNQYSSLARTRIKMAELYRAEQMTDPTEGLKWAQEKLPTLVNEKAMNEERTNLAVLLVDIAENLANEASKLKETDDKKRLLEKLDEQQELINDPNYMLSSMKETLSGRLLQISETRARVLREIKRNLELDETEAAMKTALAAKDSKTAYDGRMELLREFPELQNETRLVTLINEACQLQKTLVEPSAKMPKLSTDPLPEAAQRQIVLTNVEGDKLPGLDDDIYYLRTGGSVLAFSIGDGRLLWRKFTGFGEDHTPLRLDDGAAVLLSDMATQEVRRINGSDGELAWRCSIDETFAEPVAGRRSVLVSGASGRLLSLDQKSGRANWGAQIPQSLTVAPGLDDSTERVYLPGDHSNLYVLNARDGSAIESYYIGHAAGTIRVPPVSLLGHLFVIENAGSDYARVHVLRLDKDGQSLKPAQPPFRLVGNVIVPPVISDARRLIVLTDRGQVAVYDVEPTSDRDQVSLIASQAASYDSPTMTRMAVGRGQVWITGTRIGRFELQINTGRVVYDWGKFEGDQFVGQPLLLGDALVHARVLRGTSAVRVTASVPKTGEPVWSTDVGTPIAAIRQVKVNGRRGPEGQTGPTGGFHVITSQAALFELDGQSLQTGSTKPPIDNPGKLGVSMRFADPVAVDDNRLVMLNQNQRDQAIIYDPTRRSEQLRKVTLPLTDAKPTGPSVFSGGGLMLPLESGRVVLLDWQTGAPKGSPFQPASDPTNRVKWTNPVVVPGDADQVVIADSRKKLYRLRVGDQLKDLQTASLDKPFLGRTAGAGDQFIGAIAGPSADFLIGYDLMKLTKTFSTPMDGRVIWGPVSASTRRDNEAVLLMTDDRVLRCFESTGKQRFEVALTVPGQPLDEMVEVEGRWLVTGEEGWMMLVEPASGDVVGTIELGQRISAAPLSVGSRLLVPGAEGVIYITGLPGAAE